MRLARFLSEGCAKIGLVDGDGICILSDRIPAIGADMKKVIADWDQLRPKLEAIRGVIDTTLADVRLLSPIDRPGKIWGIGHNYADHARETGRELPAHQV